VTRARECGAPWSGVRAKFGGKIHDMPIRNLPDGNRTLPGYSK